MRRTGHIVSVILTAAAAGLFAAAPAKADVVDLACTPPSNEVNTFDPPLTNEPQPTTITTTRHYNPCVSLTHPTVVSGTSSSESDITTSCFELLNSRSFTKKIKWNTGQTSTLSGTYQASQVGVTIVVTSTGTVTSGLFAGQSFVETKESPSTDITLCTAGLSEVDTVFGVLTLSIYSL
jgi:hypothetical protein